MKNNLNYELMESHIREAAGELDSLLSRIQFMLGRPNKAGELQVGTWGPRSVFSRTKRKRISLPSHRYIVP